MADETKVVKDKRLKHGHTAGGKVSPEYNSWAQMLTRCNNPGDKNFKDYGGRGIKVCGLWVEFKNFYADMGERPKGTTLDRIDNNGDYCQGNCRWATQEQQHRNKRSNRLLSCRGVTQCAQAWADQLKMSKHTLFTRLRLGWSMKQIVDTPVRSYECRTLIRR